jgi:hypothetical protein
MKKSKSISAAALVVDEEMQLLRFGHSLYEQLVQVTPAVNVSDLQLARFGDYLQHFGFSMEREFPAVKQQPAKQNASTVERPSTRRAAEELSGTLSAAEQLVDGAGWGCCPSEQSEADSKSALAGAMTGEADVARLTHALVGSFERCGIHQRQDECDRKKSRAVYRWLCDHFTVELVEPSLAEGQAAVSPAKVEKKGVGRKAAKKVSPQAAEALLPLDPLVVALETRCATPAVLSALYQAMLRCAGVTSEVVTGWLKGPSVEEAVEWSWNMVEEQGTRYVVDVAYSIYDGPLRRAEVAEVEVAMPGKKSPRSALVAAKKEAKSESLPKVLAGERSPAASPADAWSRKGPQLRRERTGVETFYFFTAPHAFSYTHFPLEARHALLTTPPTRTAWDILPCLKAAYFQFPLRLHSHPRHRLLHVRNTPFYISIKNENPSTTELCCVLYKGTLRELDEDWTRCVALGSEWVWLQRQESTMTETFTVMVPDSGYYCAVIGARSIRADPYGALLSSDSFVPVVTYQVMVNFVSVNVPLMPRQHLSPSVCKLLSPLTRQIVAGEQHFVVMPSCANVLSVAVVCCTSASSGVGGDRSESRRLVCFLSFSSTNMTYEGSALLRAGETAEVWILYSAPDKNGVSMAERSAIEDVERVVLPAVTVVAKPSAKGVKAKKGALPPGPTPEEQAKCALLRQLSKGRVFCPLVTQIEVRKMLPRDAESVIQPRLVVEAERVATLRWLIGITPRLYQDAKSVRGSGPSVMGQYFASRSSRRIGVN